MAQSYGGASYGKNATAIAVAGATTAANSALASSQTAAQAIVNIQAGLQAVTNTANGTASSVGDLVSLVQNAASKGPNVFTGSQDSTVVNHGTVTAGEITIDFSAGNVQAITIAGPVTLVFDGFPTVGIFTEIQLDIVDGGAFPLTLPGEIVFTDPTTGLPAASLSAYMIAIGRTSGTLNAAGKDTFYFRTSDNGVTVEGRLL